LRTNELAQVLGEWEGYWIGIAERFEAGVKGERAEVWIELHLSASRPGVCSGCGQTVAAVHEYEERWVRDPPILDADTHLCVQQRRLACSVIRRSKSGSTMATPKPNTAPGESPGPP